MTLKQHPAYEAFQFLLLLVFQGKNLFRFLNSKHKDQAVSKNAYYRFLNETSYNWNRFLLLLAARVIAIFDKLTRKERVKVLALGWSDGYSFIPVGFNALSSAAESNRYQEMSADIDRRSNGYKVRKESLMAKTNAAIMLIQRDLNTGIQADYVLMDTWFTTNQ